MTDFCYEIAEKIVYKKLNTNILNKPAAAFNALFTSGKSNTYNLSWLSC